MTDAARLSALESVRLGRDLAVDDPPRCPCGEDHYSERHQKCPRCEQVFNGTTIGDAHLVHRHPPAGYVQGGIGIYAECPCERSLGYHHYCLNADTMRERGWWQDDRNVWHMPGPAEPIRRGSHG